MTVSTRWFYCLILLTTSLANLIAPPANAQETVRDPRFGVVEAFWDTGAANEANVAWERILFYWSQIQPGGPEDWNTLHVPDEWLQEALAQGREVVGLLKNTPAWAAASNPHLESSPPKGLDLPVDDPNNLWANYVRRVVAHYGPRGVHRWIIWNEPDIKPGVYGQEWGGTIEEYYRLLKVAYTVIKQNDPAATVHLAGLTFWHDRQWLNRFLAVAAADPDAAANNFFFDVVSLHIYFQTDTVDFIVNTARAALSAYGLQKPIWINETNASPDSDPLWPVVRPAWRVDLREQASFIMQAYALGLAAGAQRIAVYKLIDAGLPQGGEPFGLLRPDHSRRPAYTAYQLVTSHYAGAHSAQLFRDPLWSQITLFHADRTTRVLWARTESDVTLTLDAASDSALLVDQEGNEQVLDGTGGSYSLVLPAARCADEVMGCIIGGPTYLLVEYSTQSPGAPSGVVESAGNSGAGQDVAPTTVSPITATNPISIPLPAAPYQTSTPSPAPPPTEPFTPSPTRAIPTPTPTATRIPRTSTPAPPTATATTTLEPTILIILSPSPTLFPSPTVTLPATLHNDRSSAPFVTGGAVLVFSLLGLALWRMKRKNLDCTR
ncbi:MAG: hypothetical protein JXA42_12685 [Anaerolineales bacterium]|nr:hypothetical protein [Anaerolineales bacterium]